MKAFMSDENKKYPMNSPVFCFLAAQALSKARFLNIIRGSFGKWDLTLSQLLSFSSSESLKTFSQNIDFTASLLTLYPTRTEP